MVGGAIWEGCAEPLETFSAKLAGLGGCNRNVYIGVNFSERKSGTERTKKWKKQKSMSARDEIIALPGVLFFVVCPLRWMTSKGFKSSKSSKSAPM